MCVLAFAWAAHPRWRLVAIANRDEFHARPSAPLDRWGGDEGIIAGRDLQSGGTWLGVSETGRFVAVTNLRGYGLPDPAKASRGALVTDLLSGGGAEADLSTFNPFNLVVAGGDEVEFLTNRPTPVRTTLSHGIYGLSNGALDAPWPKTLQLKSALTDWLAEEGDDPADLFAALRSEQVAHVGIAPSVPSDVPEEAMTSPVFIRNPVYGTRCSTVVAVDADGRGTIIERRFNADGETTGETALEFNWR